MTRRRQALARTGAAIAAVVLLAAGCGIQPDGDPTPIASEDLPEELLDPNPPTSGTTVPGVTTPVTVYLLVTDGEITRLAPVQREVADPSRAADRIVALLQPTTEEEQAAGYLSSIPPDTVLLDTDLIEDRKELVVDLSGALFDVEGKELANAFAQIVWTVAELDGVSQVRFRVDGEDYRVPDADGIEQSGAVTPADYRSLAPRN